MTLAAFDISKVVENGVEVTPEIASVPGTIWYVSTQERMKNCSLVPMKSSSAV